MRNPSSNSKAARLDARETLDLSAGVEESAGARTSRAWGEAVGKPTPSHGRVNGGSAGSWREELVACSLLSTATFGGYQFLSRDRAIL